MELLLGVGPVYTYCVFAWIFGVLSGSWWGGVPRDSGGWPLGILGPWGDPVVPGALGLRGPVAPGGRAVPARGYAMPGLLPPVVAVCVHVQ